MSKRRKFSPQFKSQVVQQLLSGEKSISELCREQQLTAQMVGNWRRQFLAAASRAFESEATHSAQQERIGQNAALDGPERSATPADKKGGKQ